MTDSKKDVEIACNICTAPCCEAPVPLQHVAEFFKAINFVKKHKPNEPIDKSFIVLLAKGQENVPKEKKLYAVYVLHKPTKKCPLLSDDYHCKVHDFKFEYCKEFLCRAYGHKVSKVQLTDLITPIIAPKEGKPIVTKQTIKAQKLKIQLRDNIF